MRSTVAGCIAALLLTSCVVAPDQPKVERYTSPQIEGQSQRINLDAVEKAFFSTQGKDLNSWMSAFETRVNEIYEGPEVVSIDATRETGKLNVAGYIEKNKQAGFQTGEDKLFALEQTGDVVNNQMPYRVADEHGNTYHQGHYSLFDNPIIQALVIGNLLSGAFGPRYYTPLPRIGDLRSYRDSYRQSPGFNNQRVANNQFQTRYRQRAAGSGVGSRTGFGRTPGTTSGARSRTWSNPSPTYRSPSPWSGRRPMGRGWGMRRR